jgi:hypothetical protein
MFLGSHFRSCGSPCGTNLASSSGDRWGLSMEDNDAKVGQEYRKLIFMEEVCGRASSIGKAALDRGEKLDTMKAFEQALLEVLEHDGRNKNELTTLWAMLMLGAQAVKKLCAETDSYTIGQQPQRGQPPPE